MAKEIKLSQGKVALIDDRAAIRMFAAFCCLNFPDDYNMPESITV